MSHPDLSAEQAHLDAVYARLAHEIETARRRLAGVRTEAVGGVPQSRFEREAFAANLEDRVSVLRAHNRDDLCFGRIDMAHGERYYIGRLGLSGEDQEVLLVDWRAPVAAPFYQATAREPQGVVRRRHFLTRARTIEGIEDEVLDAARVGEGEAASLRGEAALQYAMNTARTGRMREIAATIQKEQDEIIRAPLTPGVFVQGGPGTGKTAVALHRAAYLLYTYRRQLASSDVLVIGPNPLFLRYIEHVLPSLGESGADLSAVPAVYAKREWRAEDERPRAVKARPAMIDLIARAIATRRRPLRRPVHLSIDGEAVTVRRRDTTGIVAAARNRKGRHNERAVYVHGRLLRLVWDRAGASLHDRWEFEDFRAEYLAHPMFRRLTMRVWPVLTPEALLNDLFGFPALLAEAAQGVLDPGEAGALQRPWSPRVKDAGWAAADAPLLDEAAAQLGPVPEDLDPARRRVIDPEALEEARAEAEYARERTRGLGGGIVPRQMLEDRRTGGAPQPGSDADADGEAGGRLWRYAVVDEAQDLSPMAWRMIGRHAPRRAVTAVGDLAQGTEPWSPRGWDEVRTALDARRDAVMAELTINYRTPLEIAGWAADVLARVDLGLTPPDSARSVPGAFSSERVDRSVMAERAAARALALSEELGDGITCVIVSPADLEALRAAFEAASGLRLAPPQDPASLDGPVTVTTPALAKGLEFDGVVIADPDTIVAAQGWRALYVSATRATRRLVVLHTGPEPLAAEKSRPAQAGISPPQGESQRTPRLPGFADAFDFEEGPPTP